MVFQFSSQRVSKDIKVSPYSDISLLSVWMSGLNKSQFMTKDQNIATERSTLLLAEEMKDQTEDVQVKE